VARRQDEADARSPLSRAQLDALLDYLADRIAEGGHDKSFRHTREWLSRNGIPVEPALAFFATHRLADDWSVAVDGDPHKLFGPTALRLARMPIPPDALEALIGYVDGRVRDAGCDNTRRFTREWLAREGWPVHPTEFALIAQGGGCDCEVVMNVEPSNIYPRGGG